MKPLRAVVIACLLPGTLVLGACSASSSGGAATSTTVPSSTNAATTTSPTSAAASSPSASPSATSSITSEAIGALQTAGPVTATVLAYDPTPSNPDGLTPLTPGYVWRAIQVRVCATTDSGTSPTPWALQTQDGALLTTAEYGPASPNYQGASPLLAGECTEGWLNFGADQRKIITTARYAPTNDDGTSAGVYRWALPTT